MNQSRCAPHRLAPALSCLILITLNAGCGQKSPSAKLPVSGKVFVNDEPLTKGHVMFRAEPADPKGAMAIGDISETGDFELKTNGVTGAAKGRYKVAVFLGKPGIVPKDAPFHPKFASFDDTPLVIEVVESPTPGAYDLRLSSK